MEIVSQHTKKIMEGCKKRAKDAGLKFDNETLEYIVTNRDLIELSPKIMIPTLYDYWVHDVEVLREKGKYELYPSNPYETVINTRPAISFYNDNNPDWLNVMIFYHVLAHIDFFQNNSFFRHTWGYDFTGQALADKREIAQLRTEHGRWVDYVIEFARGIDNIVGYYDTLSLLNRHPKTKSETILDYYFDIFLQKEKKVKHTEYIKEIELYNKYLDENNKLGESAFFSEAHKKYPEFKALYEKHNKNKGEKVTDLLQFLIESSPFLNKEDNAWMKTILQIVRNTSLFFQPQIRTKIMNEGWASFWHETLFLKDNRINGHEVDFARVNSGVTSMPRVGLNPYALGMRMFYNIEDKANKGKCTVEFEKLLNIEDRQKFDSKKLSGRDYIFKIRENLSDFLFINYFIDQDFVTENKLFVAGKRLNQQKMVWEYYVKSRNFNEYKKMLFNSLYHPPYIQVDLKKTDDDSLYLIHEFEEKPLVHEYIPNTMLGIEYLWGGPIHLESHEVISAPPAAQGRGFVTMPSQLGQPPTKKPEIKWQKVVYTMKNKRISKKRIS